MAGPAISGKLQSHRYYDTINSGVNPVAPYQIISPLTSAQLTTFSAAQGEAVRPAVASGTTVLERVIGISEHGAKHNTQIAVRVDGIAHVMAGAAVAYGSLLQMGLAEQRTNAQSPFIDLYEAALPQDPSFTITYNLSMADDVAISPASGGANALILPVGYALEAATAKYQLVRVELHTAPFYA